MLNDFHEIMQKRLFTMLPGDVLPQPAAVWERWVGAQTPAEFLAHLDDPTRAEVVAEVHAYTESLPALFGPEPIDRIEIRKAFVGLLKHLENVGLCPLD